MGLFSAPAPPALDQFAEDVRECLGRFEPKPLRAVLRRLESRLPSLDAGERFLALLDVHRTWENADYRYSEHGLLCLTNERVIWASVGASGASGFEAQLAAVPLSSVRTESIGQAGEYVHIGFGAGADDHHVFDIGGRSLGGKPHNQSAYVHFVSTLKRSVTATSGSTSAKLAAGGSHADELAKFARLRDDGVITAAEFELKKQKILGL